MLQLGNFYFGGGSTAGQSTGRASILSGITSNPTVYSLSPYDEFHGWHITGGGAFIHCVVRRRPFRRKWAKIGFQLNSASWGYLQCPIQTWVHNSVRRHSPGRSINLSWLRYRLRCRRQVFWPSYRHFVLSKPGVLTFVLRFCALEARYSDLRIAILCSRIRCSNRRIAILCPRSQVFWPSYSHFVLSKPGVLTFV